jgi:RNA polymerase sigma-70 factor, ECF subfamily
MRTDLCAEALRLGLMLASLTPHDTESLGLLALIELHTSRLKARTGPDGDPVLLMDQDRTRWDHRLIRRGLATLERIDHLGAGARPYALQAAIAACHARATTAEAIDWVRIAALYDGLAQINPSPIVELNRGVAIAQASGPQAGLDIVLPLFDVAELRKYYRYVPFDKLRAHKSRRRVADDLLCRIGEHDPARKKFLSAAALTSNTPERATMQRRAAQHENEILSNRLNPI